LKQTATQTSRQTGQPASQQPDMANTCTLTFCAVRLFPHCSAQAGTLLALCLQQQ
jgi:hypothetical protein